MQSTGLRTGQPAINRGLMGALLAVVVTAVAVAVLIVGTIARTTIGPVAAPDPVSLDAAARADSEFRALEPAAYAAMLEDAEEQALIQFRADERAVLTPQEQAAAIQDAVRKFHADERAARTVAAQNQGLAEYYKSARDANAAWTYGEAGHGGKFAR